MGGIMKKEYWKPVVGYEGLYEVSNWGRVKSIKFGKEIILTQHIRCGYYIVSLWKNGKGKTYSVHRLVAEAFLEIPEELRHLEGTRYLQVNHKDEDKNNNNIDNLEWCDAKYNTNFGTCIERRSKKKSKPVLQYDLEGNFIKEWESIAECNRNGFLQSKIILCCQKKQKTHKDFIWKYK